LRARSRLRSAIRIHGATRGRRRAVRVLRTTGGRGGASSGIVRRLLTSGRLRWAIRVGLTASGTAVRVRSSGRRRRVIVGIRLRLSTRRSIVRVGLRLSRLGRLRWLGGRWVGRGGGGGTSGTVTIRIDGMSRGG